MSWRTRFRARQYVKGSLWLLPLIAGLGGLVLAELAYWLEGSGDVPFLQYSPETATAVVSATIAAVVSLTGFVRRAGDPGPRGHRRLTPGRAWTLAPSA
jgi:hypothetical protein